MRWSHLFRPLFGLMLLSLSSTWARATHLVGGEMTYTHLGNNQYQITLTVYRDCGPTNTLGTGFDDQVYVGLWDGTGQIQPNDVVTMGLAGSNVSNVPVVLGNPCGTPPEELCIEKAIYTTVVSLPPTTYGWDLIWQRCCRNPSISNLQNFGGTDNPGATLVAHVPGDVPGLTDAHENSAPTFASLPPVAVCANFEFIWDHSAVDVDGDELVYSLCSPLDGGGTGGGMAQTALCPIHLRLRHTRRCRFCRDSVPQIQSLGIPGCRSIRPQVSSQAHPPCPGNTPSAFASPNTVTANS